jgi:hypothetical protein
LVDETRHHKENGFYFEVDVEYPQELHEENSDLNFLPESKVTTGGKMKNC